MKRRLRGERGYTLIETMAALLIFSIVTVGVVPLLGSSMRAATMSRSFTVGKNVAIEAMERIRGLPFFVSYEAQSSRVDVLDLYFPTATASGRYTTVCTAATTAQAPCPKNVSPTYQTTFEAEFVSPDSTDPAAETYTLVMPPGDYAWNSAGNDLPPARLLSMKVTVSWPIGTETKTYSLSTLLSDRKFTTERVQGTGEISYVAQVITSYADASAGRRDELVLTAGTAVTQLETRALSEVDQSVVSGTIDLTREATNTQPSEALVGADGATVNLHAPPDLDPAAGASVGTIDVNHPTLGINVALLGPTTVSDTAVKVASELPIGRGTFGLSPASGTTELTVDNQADLNEGNAMHLRDPDDYGYNPLFAIRSSTGGNRLSGSASGTTTSLTSGDRKVETLASGDFGQASLFPVDFISTGTGAVIVIEDFVASVRCTSRATLGSEAVAQYSAALYYWRETNFNDSTTAGSYVRVDLSDTTGTDPLKAVGNPMVYESSGLSGEGNAKDVYLFPVRHEIGDPGITRTHTVAHSHAGYLSSWDSLPAVAESVTDGGRVTTAAIEGAIQITTVPTNPAIPESALALSFGKLGCRAVDKR